ncbi:MAG: type II toxin-antitoxin system VapC family toxin [Erysipelotrichaceae bacterium]|nr:type II toxin-antitoxin system VapC family toxin [Erysipelotrichaceae bacterium]
MTYMLDTNAIIMAVKHPDWPTCARIIEHLGKDICISAITYGELEYGIQKSRNPSRNKAAIMQILFGIPILDFDMKAAEHFGDIFADLESRNARISDRDMLIAAHARSLGYTVVTNNTGEFSRVKDLKITDWK